MVSNKRKIINDPIYGFVTLPDDLVYDLINHPIFQRLRRTEDRDRRTDPGGWTCWLAGQAESG